MADKASQVSLPADAENGETLRQLADESDIRNLTARFSDTAIRRDYDGFRALWTPDAVWEIKEPLPSSATGTDAIVTMLQGLMDTFEFFVQMVHSGVVTVEGDSANARWITQEMGRGKDDRCYYNNYAIYDDRLIRQDGVWRFARRTYDYMYLDDSAFMGKAYALPAELGMS